MRKPRPVKPSLSTKWRFSGIQMRRQISSVISKAVVVKDVLKKYVIKEDHSGPFLLFFSSGTELSEQRLDIQTVDNKNRTHSCTPEISFHGKH